MVSEDQFRRRAEHTIAGLRTLFAQSRHFAALLSPGGRILYLNAQALAVPRMPPDGLVGLPFWSCPWWHPTPTVPPLIEGAFRIAAAGQAFQMETTYRAADGDERWMELGFVPLRHTAGDVQLVSVNGADTTQRRRLEGTLRGLQEQSERQRRMYETTLGNSPDLAYVFDRQYRFVYANAATLRMWGRTREEAIGRTCLELGYAQWHHDMHVREIDQVVATRQPIRGEVPYEGPLGRRVYDYIFTPVLDERGEVDVVVGNTRDVTARKEHEEKLAAVAADLAELDRRKTEFLAVLAHELRNPLAPIANALQILDHAGGNPLTVRHTADVMRRQLGLLVRLVDDLMDVNRINRGIIRLQRERVVLSSVLDGAVEACQPAMRDAAQFLARSPVPPDLVLDADPARLTQVFGNLLGNASKYSPSGSTIRLEATREGGMAVVSVRDEGIGIPPELRERIFEMYAQGAASPGRVPGLGIGLALARTLAELHGGSVSCESAGDGCGSVFTVRLPLPAPERPEVEAMLAGPASDGLAALRGLRILVVDDNLDAALSLQMLLETLGNEVYVAHDGASALARVPDVAPDLVMLDIGLPGLDGFEVCRRLRLAETGRRLPLVALTGWGQEADRRRSEEAGFDAHLVKPVDLAELAAVVRRVAEAER